jgi:CheY-like chemotaxis protein
MRALVVDDHPTSRGLLTRSLTDLGMEHRAAESGEGALEILKSGERFDFVVADHHMPGMTGSRFLQIAGDEGLLQGLREATLLLCSGPPPGDECHADRTLLKPLATFELAEALADLLDGRDRLLSPSPGLSKALPPGQKENLRILVAEDNADNQFLMEVYLKRGGYDAVLVENGKEALAAWENGDFSLVIMDGQMPEMDGLQAAAAIRAREQGQRSIPIIGVTAYAQESDRERFLRAGMTDYLTKPVAYADLVAAIERCRAAEPLAA